MKLYNKDGFNYREVILSIIVLCMGALAISPLIGIAIYDNVIPDGVGSANAIAQREIKMLVKNDYNGTMPFVSTTNSMGGFFKVYRVIEDNSTNPSIPIGINKIRVTVSWTDQQNIPRSVFFSTLKAKI